MLLSALLSVVGIGIAWEMFVYWRAVSQVTLPSLFLIVAEARVGIDPYLEFYDQERPH
ncbi:MAG: hypothetical protein IH870_02895 [Chloroflexi bacterium]|nr:hypothetical protein [Chloroflexota bacterium]